MHNDSFSLASAGSGLLLRAEDVQLLISVSDVVNTLPVLVLHGCSFRIIRCIPSLSLNALMKDSRRSVGAVALGTPLAAL